MPEDLSSVAHDLARIASLAEDPAISEPIQARIDAANEVGHAFSGSWLGYHSLVYQDDLEAVAGAVFDSQWGFTHLGLSDTRGRWGQFDRDGVKQAIRDMSDVDLSEIEDRLTKAGRDVGRLKETALSILSFEIGEGSDAFLERLRARLEKVRTVSAREAVSVFQPRGQFVSRDMPAVSGGVVTPPHIEMLAEAVAMSSVMKAAEEAEDIVRQAASHVDRKTRRKSREDHIGTNVFIGHGRSPLWRELKDFVEDRMRLPVDEFNRVPVAGVTNIARLVEMLDAAAIAFVIMTAEDETSEGRMQARMNVIHEVGLFQGRLGFHRAIVMLEDGCEEFSNVQGLGQIRFPRGRIAAVFEEVRQVLEREGLDG